MQQRHRQFGNALPQPLTQQYALATKYYADAHPSLPNYFMLTAGNLVGSDDLFTGTVTADNVVRALTNAGKSWKVYAEAPPNTTYTGTTVYPYGKDHNPFAYFSDVVNSSGPQRISFSSRNLLPTLRIMRCPTTP